VTLLYIEKIEESHYVKRIIYFYLKKSCDLEKSIQKLILSLFVLLQIIQLLSKHTRIHESVKLASQVLASHN